MIDNIRKLHIKLNSSEYDIYIGKNILSNIDDYFNLQNKNNNRKFLIITDDNIPLNYINSIKNKLNNCYVHTIKHGEKNKNFDNYKQALESLIDNAFTRTDCIIALGGGVVGDLSGFVANTFMRGIDFYNVPTTLLSQVDSSIGGKTAIDFMNVKNIVGTFYQPKGVLIDVETLNSLPIRELTSGFVESVKISATFDKEFFSYLSTAPDILKNATEIIYKSLLLKKNVVEKDEKENNLRKVLNFGHTIGHAIEESMNLEFLHGECVGMGMLYFSSNKVKKLITDILKQYNLPISCNYDKNKVLDLIKHDKKASGDLISTIYVDDIGSYKIKKMSISEISKLLN